jgi:aminoacyl tRNA synthase complex-interacting multifunctional protein 1
MCASTPEKVELLQPSADCKPGDRVECDGFNCSSPDAQVKKELCDQILPMMKTNDQGEATFNGTVWRVGQNKGLIKSTSLVNVPIK